MVLVATFLVFGAAPASAFSGPTAGGVAIEFILFALVLAGVALWHRHTLPIAVGGALAIALYKITASPFRVGAGLSGFAAHVGSESVLLTNLLLLLLGFALLASHFEKSRVPEILPRWLPDGWLGGFVLLVLVAALSSFLDNIAAAMIGGTVAAAVFKRRVHVGYLAAIVAASNAGGAGSVVGDTTTTMMWIAGVKPGEVVEAYIAAAVSLALFGVLAARQQHRYEPIERDAAPDVKVDRARLVIVIFILAVAVAVNVVTNTHYQNLTESIPFIGIGVWVAIVLAIPLRAPDFSLLPAALKGSIFLLSLVLSASMMPVEELPRASWQTAFGLGFLSAVFDNIPLTALALQQGGFDWGFVAYAVGFGGSMIWFGSSAGVALATMFPEAKSAARWLRAGWHVALAYIVGFFAMLVLIGFHPDTRPRTAPPAIASESQS